MQRSGIAWGQMPCRLRRCTHPFNPSGVCGGTALGRRQFWIHGARGADLCELRSGSTTRPPRLSLVEEHPRIWHDHRFPQGSPVRLFRDFITKKTSRLTLPNRVSSFKLVCSLAIRTAVARHRATGWGRRGLSPGRPEPRREETRGCPDETKSMQPIWRRRKQDRTAFENATNEPTCHFGRRRREAGIVDATNEPIPVILAGGEVSQGDGRYAPAFSLGSSRSWVRIRARHPAGRGGSVAFASGPA